MRQEADHMMIRPAAVNGSHVASEFQIYSGRVLESLRSSGSVCLDRLVQDASNSTGERVESTHSRLLTPDARFLQFDRIILFLNI